jgi:hypothetical protein
VFVQSVRRRQYVEENMNIEKPNDVCFDFYTSI